MKISTSILIGLGAAFQNLHITEVAGDSHEDNGDASFNSDSSVVAPTFSPETNDTIQQGDVVSNMSTSDPNVGDVGYSVFQALEPPTYLFEHTDAIMGLCPPRFLDSALIKNRAIPTNNWWGNIIAHDSNAAIQPIWSNPYSLQMVVDKAPFGMSVSYPYRSRFSGGSSGNNGAVKYYAHGQNREFQFSAVEIINQKPSFQVVDWADQGVTVKFTAASYGGTMVSDLVSGMVYSSMKYSSLTPRLVSSAAISSINGQPCTGQIHGSKFEIVYNSGQKWVLYALSSDGLSDKDITLTADGPFALKSTGTFDGILRVALALEDSWLPTLDQHKSCIVQAATIDLHDDTSYAFKWKTAGDCSCGLLHYAMIHHSETIDKSSGVCPVEGMVAYSTTRGAYQAFTTPKNSGAPVWEIKETQPVPEDFYPSRKITSDVVQQQRIVDHLRGDINAAWSIPRDGSYYFNGKAAQKYASLCLIANDPAIVRGDKSLLNLCLNKLRGVMAPFVANSWTNKLQYDRIYGGIVSSQGFKTRDLNADFGNTMYNDHHFHYGYWVHTAAIINRLDPSWNDLPKLNSIVNLLIRDVANFDPSDKFFARFRSFDWFRGHSYSHGVTPFADGKDQESTSEDVNFAFGMYMYGKATKNVAMEAIGKLMTRVNTHAIKTYFLIEDANQIHPDKFRPNKVTGIFFDNKVDYATWFSAEKHCIHGIQMIPVSAVTEYVRTKQFVKEEWEQVLSKESIVTREDTGNSWLSLLYANFAIVDKQRALRVLQKAKMDDGLSRSWALYMAASFAELCLFFYVYNSYTLYLLEKITISMSKFRVVQLTQEALKIQCKVDDFEQWGAPYLTLSQYLKKEEIQRATTFSKRGSIFWALVDKNEDCDVKIGDPVLYCHCESHRFDCVVRHSSGEIERGYSYHIGSVFTLPVYRNQGLATYFITEVAKQLRTLPNALLSVLYSDIGPTFYDKLGWKVYSSTMAVLSVGKYANTRNDSSVKLEFLTLKDNLDKLLKDDNIRLVNELASDRFQRQKAFAILPTCDSIEWQFCIGVHFAQVRQYKELPSCCGVVANNDAFIVWCHNFKESTLYVLRARWSNDSDTSTEMIKLLLNEAIKEARRFKLDKVAIWAPPSILTKAEVCSHFEMNVIEREDSLSSAMMFSSDSSKDELMPSPYWLANEKYAWV
ncbi:putative endo-1,3(4)-beta-glucanase, acyl-CoA N-acyltransferase, glycosyl hydrolase family 81 [Plasmopara halstedii]